MRASSKTVTTVAGRAVLVDARLAFGREICRMPRRGSAGPKLRYDRGRCISRSAQRPWANEFGALVGERALARANASLESILAVLSTKRAR
jgi:hypothetical protein